MEKKFIFGMILAVLLLIAACSKAQTSAPSASPQANAGQAITGDELVTASDTSSDLVVDSPDQNTDAGLTDIQNI